MIKKHIIDIPPAVKSIFIFHSQRDITLVANFKATVKNVLTSPALVRESGPYYGLLNEDRLQCLVHKDSV